MVYTYFYKDGYLYIIIDDDYDNMYKHKCTFKEYRIIVSFL